MHDINRNCFKGEHRDIASGWHNEADRWNNDMTTD